MKYVIDASVGFKWEVVESDSDKALGLREDFRRGTDELLAPEIFVYLIAEQSRATIYDCLYVALAEREGCELISADERLVRALQGTFPFVRSLASMP